MPSGGSGGGSGMGGGGLATSIVSSVANIGAGWFANNRLNKGTNEAIAQQGKANKLYTQLYGETQADYKPYQEAGTSALEALTASLGLNGQQPDYSGFYNSPDYQFNFNQGLAALDHSAAAHGTLYSGQQMKAAQQFGQGLASNYLNTYRQGLGNLSTQGLQATNALSNYRAGYGNQLGTGLTNIGDLLYARRIGQANINYRNVAAQDQIWGAYSSSPKGGGPSSYVSGMNFGNGPGQNNGPGSGYYSGPGSSSYDFGGGNWLNQGWGG